MVKYTGRGLVVKRPGVLSEVQLLNLVLGVGVFSLLPRIMNLSGGKLFYLQLEFFCLELSFFACSPLRPLLDALSHCKQKSINCK